ncbi:hypothetical protein AAD018_016565 [Aestuariibius insulae]|uniref:hypothetical protein n=1 Tax=Aestuariibius insulae TaxID=2058287 RepID=UPI00345F0FE7
MHGRLLPVGVPYQIAIQVKTGGGLGVHWSEEGRSHRPGSGEPDGADRSIAMGHWGAALTTLTGSKVSPHLRAAY